MQTIVDYSVVSGKLLKVTRSYPSLKDRKDTVEFATVEEEQIYIKGAADALAAVVQRAIEGTKYISVLELLGLLPPLPMMMQAQPISSKPSIIEEIGM